MAGTGITLCTALDRFAQEMGVGGDRCTLLDEIAEAVEFVLHSGGGELLREWVVPVHSGRFTLPRELETPVKYKIENVANAGFGVFNSAYFSYSSAGVVNTNGYEDWQFEMQPRKVPTQFRMPPRGGRVVCTTKHLPDVGAKLSMAAMIRGQSIAPMHKGHKTAGEILQVYHEEDPKKRYSSFCVDDITNIVRDKTERYVMLSCIESGTNKPYFLSYYHPDEEVPKYTEVALYHNNRTGYGQTDQIVRVLGRINSGIIYSRDEDVLPITSLQMLKLLAKRAKYDADNQFDNVILMEQRIQKIIRKQKAYQQAPGRQLAFNLAAGGGSITNL